MLLPDERCVCTLLQLRPALGILDYVHRPLIRKTIRGKSTHHHIGVKSYASDCRLFTPEHPHSKMANISGAMDMFVIAHLGGWMVKMFALRDFKLAMIQQIMFELMEITFRHWLPNFYECWWDHIILDIILCNTGGILVAYYLMKKFGMREYKWSLSKAENKLTFA